MMGVSELLGLPNSWVMCTALGVENISLFDHSTNIRMNYDHFVNFVTKSQEFCQIIKHVSTRLLCLEIAVERCLKQFPSLKSYFLSNHELQARLSCLSKAFEDPMTELHLLSMLSVLPIFTNADKVCKQIRGKT